MMLKTLNEYFKYSGLWMGIIFNPYHWNFTFEFLHPDELNPNMRGLYFNIGPIWVRAILDNGTW